MGKLIDFVVDTEGQCFFCLTQLPSPSPSNMEHDKGTSSILGFSRYLGMDLRKVFLERENIHPKLLSKVQRSRLKVVLCEDCAATIGKLSMLYEQLEKIEIEMSFHLNHIQEKLLNAKDNQLNMLASTDEFKQKQEIVDVLRAESLQKCSSRMDMSSPKVKVQNLSMPQLNVKMKKRPEHPIAPASHDAASTNFEPRWGADTQLDQYDMDHNPSGQEANDNYSDYDNDYIPFGTDRDAAEPVSSLEVIKQEHASLSPDAQIQATKPAHIVPVPVTTSNANLKCQSRLNPKTGKYQCGICYKEFSVKHAVQLHYKGVHLKVKYKCRLCSQEFSQKGTYDRHHQSVHVGVRFKCGICNKSFTRKGQLSLHQATCS